jgi:SepF-like predicted cell division protein (DUF552 family)
MAIKIDKDGLDQFTSNVKDFFNLKSSDQIDYFLYYLTVVGNSGTIQITPIRDCFVISEITPYSNISQYVTSNLKPKDKAYPKFLRIRDGYQLHRNMKAVLEENIIKKPLKAKVSQDLRQILEHIKNHVENEFLKEAVDCFEISAYRASIVMVWNLTLDHLYEYVLKNELANFNNALSKNTDKRIKILTVTTKDDFSDIPEVKLIEFLRAGNIISNDIRKILDTKLGIRNTYAHPSTVKIIESKALEFIEDLVNNVILKFKI